VTDVRRGVVSGAAAAGLALTALAAVVYWFSNRDFDAGRGDFFYLADAFLHGRTWLDFRPGPFDVIAIGDRFFVPFAPFPALALAPLVTVLGPVTADQLESGINAALAALDVWLCWVLLGRLGVSRVGDRLAVAVLFAFSTAIWWVTTRGGVWHTGHLIATALTFGCLIELWSQRPRPWVVGVLAGFAFLTRAPLALAIPFYALLLDIRRPAAEPEIEGGFTPSSRSEVGPCWRSASCRPWRSSSGTTSPDSATRSSPATPWRRCPRSSRRSARWACSALPTSRPTSTTSYSISRIGSRSRRSSARTDSGCPCS
jgi:hypothetical protein